MGDVIDHPARTKEPDDSELWLCQCGGQTYYLRPGPVVECASCGGIHSDEALLGGWAPPTVGMEGLERTVLRRMERAAIPPDVRIKRMTNMLADPKTLAAVAINDDGVIYTIFLRDGEVPPWAGEQRSWWRRRAIDVAAALGR